ncbi:hypothetical protein FA95DRAFT_1495778 [Auriscalpium vulgare]|uniref:Uncharacterized protein n=1 Tax=Auriscalpium vulgare TaxID=40419 RepID=A0ACB8RNG3_9AGAM|nr:hypothetical protein FA95DRAFT_1495778 [Auriscalpium vulgare]
MPIPTSQHVVNIYKHASVLPQSVWDVLRQDERRANIMYPHALKSLHTEGGEDVQLWMTCSTFHTLDTHPTLDLILSCTEGPFGSYPIFILPTAPFDALTHDYLYPRVGQLVRALLPVVGPQRVFSIFAPEPVTKLFARYWSQLTGIAAYEQPYYAAKHTYCTRETFVDRCLSIFPDLSYLPRLATESDISAVAELCFGFSSTSEPFVLTEKRARKEAKYLIRQGLIWVLQANLGSAPAEIASIVAVTRQSDAVAGITKVYTNPRWRKRGCAERLVRHVTKALLSHKRSVVLFVAHDNPAAAGVYHRVGFAGLDDSKRRVEGVEPWLEIGFDRRAVRLGHW